MILLLHERYYFCIRIIFMTQFHDERWLLLWIFRSFIPKDYLIKLNLSKHCINNIREELLRSYLRTNIAE